MNARAAMMNGVRRKIRDVIPGRVFAWTRNPDVLIEIPGSRFARPGMTCAYQPKPKSKPSGKGAGM